jgi:nucleotide-binding universal stress UspA family protein
MEARADGGGRPPRRQWWSQKTTREDRMSIVIQPRRPPASRLRLYSRPAPSAHADARSTRPVVAVVDGSADGRAATAQAIASACELGAPVVLVHVRRGPSTVWGRPFYQRRLDRALRKGREALAAAAAKARVAGVEAQTEMLEGPPARRIAEFARSRDAQLVVVGPRRRRPEASVSRSVAATGVPVLRAASRIEPAHA